MSIRLLHLVTPLFFVTLPVHAQLIDIYHFFPPDGTVSTFTGTYLSQPATVTFEEFRSAADPMRRIMTLSGTLQDGTQIETTTKGYGLNIEEQSVRVADASMTVRFDNPLVVTPRYIIVGGHYESEATASYFNINGLWTNAYQTYEVDILGVDEVSVDSRKLEVLTLLLQSTMIEIYSSGWMETNTAMLGQYVRGLGVIKMYGSSSVQLSNGFYQEVEQDLTLWDTNIALNTLGVLEHDPDYDGVVYMQHPFGYSFTEATWLYYWTDLWAYDYSSQEWRKLGNEGFLYVDFPIAYSFETGSWLYIEPNQWVYDYGIGQSFKLP